MATADQPRGGGRLEGKDVEVPAGGIRPEPGSDQHGVRSVRPGDTAQFAGTADLPKKTYRMKASAPPGMFVEGERKYPGETVELTEAQARAASQYIEESDGKQIPHEQQVLSTDVERTNLGGLARHERLDALTQEKERLQKRLAAIDQQIATEQQETDRLRSEAGQPVVGDKAKRGEGETR